MIGAALLLLIAGSWAVGYFLALVFSNDQSVTHFKAAVRGFVFGIGLTLVIVAAKLWSIG